MILTSIVQSKMELALSTKNPDAVAYFWKIILSSYKNSPGYTELTKKLSKDKIFAIRCLQGYAEVYYDHILDDLKNGKKVDYTSAITYANNSFVNDTLLHEEKSIDFEK